jgi:hypothetical protein
MSRLQHPALLNMPDAILGNISYQNLSGRLSVMVPVHVTTHWTVKSGELYL